MELMNDSFEAALARGLRTELDALNVAVPTAALQLPRKSSMRFVWAVGRPLAVALAAALLLGSVAAFASGDPSRWVREAARQLGLPPFNEDTPIGAKASPSR
jgi:hypothetical protein